MKLTTVQAQEPHQYCYMLAVVALFVLYTIREAASALTEGYI